jgi:predicted dehydrogenase
MKKIRVAVVGTGFMGKAHALALRAAAAALEDGPAAELATLCDLDAGVAREKAGWWGFAGSTDDWRRAVADPAIDAVTIATPNATHREIALATLAAGKHVWCEKPMAHSLEDAEAMAAAAASSARVALLGYNYVSNPVLFAARRLIADGALGRVFEFRGRFDEDYLADPARPWSWRLRRAEAGLGAAGDMLCHLVSLALLLVGRVERLTGMMETVHRRRTLRDRPGETAAVENEDVVHALVRFAGGATGVMSSSRVAHGRKNLLRVEIHGERGTLIFDQERLNELRLYEADGPEATRGFRTILAGPLHPPYAAFCPAPGHQLGFGDLKTIEAAHFLRCIAGREAPFVGFADGLAIERTIHAIARSAETGGWVTVG